MELIILRAGEHRGFVKKVMIMENLACLGPHVSIASSGSQVVSSWSMRFSEQSQSFTSAFAPRQAY